MDMERYGDYTEYEDDIPKSKSKFLLIMKILIILVCFSVVGVLVFRLLIFNYYPDSIKEVYFTENLTAYYDAKGGDIGAKTQDLRAPYDDPDVANFFADNLIVIEGAGELQFSMRYNVSTIENVEARYGISGLDADDQSIFSFRLVGSVFDAQAGKFVQKVVAEAPSYVGTDSALMYRYYKLAFDGIDFDLRHAWIRVEVFVEGQDKETPFAMIPVYENSDGDDGYNTFKDYDLKRKERPS